MGRPSPWRWLWRRDQGPPPPLASGLWLREEGQKERSRFVEGHSAGRRVRRMDRQFDVGAGQCHERRRGKLGRPSGGFWLCRGSRMILGLIALALIVIHCIILSCTRYLP